MLCISLQALVNINQMRAIILLIPAFLPFLLSQAYQLSGSSYNKVPTSTGAGDCTCNGGCWGDGSCIHAQDGTANTQTDTSTGNEGVVDINTSIISTLNYFLVTCKLLIISVIIPIVLLIAMQLYFASYQGVSSSPVEISVLGRPPGDGGFPADEEGALGPPGGGGGLPADEEGGSVSHDAEELEEINSQTSQNSQRTLSTSSSSPRSSSPRREGETKSQTTEEQTILIKPRIFLSYRRAHSGEARALKMELHRLGYEVFFDLDRISGLGIGPFQKQLEEALAKVEVVIVMITPAPSGPQSDAANDGGRFNMSSTETMKEYARLGWTDYCAVEVEKALLADKMIIPVYHGRHGTAWIGQQLKHLRDLPTLSKLGGFNAYDISDSLFTESVAVIDKHIQQSTTSTRTKSAYLN